MPATLPCPLCKHPIEMPAVNGATATCSICLHEFVVRAGRLAPRLDLDGLDIPVLQPDEPLPAEPRRKEPQPTAARRASRRLSEREKPAKSRRGVFIVLAVVAVVAALVVLGVVLENGPGPKPRNIGFNPPVARFAERAIIETPAPNVLLPPPQTVPVDAATDADARRFMDRVFVIVKAFDRQRFVDLFDFDQLIDRVAVVPPHQFGNRQAIREGFVQGVENNMDRERLFTDLNVFEVVSVRRAAHHFGQVEVITRATKDNKGFVVRNRFWLSKQGLAWKIIDFEDMEMPTRMSHLTSPMAQFAVDRIEPSRTTTACWQIREALQRSANSDMPGAENMLQDIDGPLPHPLEAARNFGAAVVAANRQPPQPGETLRLLDRARRFHNDAPIFDLFEAWARNQLNEWDTAVKILEAHRDRVGDDDQVCDYLGVAYLNLGRRADAAAQFRKSLDYIPDRVDVLSDLLFAQQFDAPGDDLGRRFLQLKNPEDHFERLVKECSDDHDWRAVEQLAGAMLTLAPNHELATLNLALAKIQRNQPEQAMPLIKKAIAGPFANAQSTERVLRELSRRGRSSLAYEIAPDKIDGFRIIGDELVQVNNFDDLEELIALHKKTHPKSRSAPMVLFEAIVAGERGDHAKSDTLFTLAVNMDPRAPLLEREANLRRLNRYRLGRAMSAYNEIGPKDQAFQQLSWLAWDDRDQPLLTGLMEAHRAFNPTHQRLPEVRWQIALMGDDAQELASAGRANLRRADTERKYILAEMLHDAVDLDKSLAAYRALSEDSLAAFADLGAVLSRANKYAELNQLAAEHKKQFADDPWLDVFDAQRLWQTDRAKAVLEKTVTTKVTQAYRRADAESKQKMRPFMIDVNVVCGRWHDAYRELKGDHSSVVSIAHRLSATRQWDNLESLLEQYPPGNDAQLLGLSIALAVERKDFGGAKDIYQRAGVQPQIVRGFVTQMAQVGRAVEAYELVADKKVALNAAAESLLLKRKFDDLEALLKVHEKNRPGDPAALVYRGEIHLHRGDLAKAEADFKKALDGDRADWRVQNNLRSIRIKKGEAAQALAENADGRFTFANLAQTCQTLNDAGQLEQLIAARQKMGRPTPETRRWEIILFGLKKDDAAVVKTIAAMREEKTPQGDKHFLSEKLVRALVHLKKHDEAVQEAETQAKVRFADRLPVVLAYAAKGDVAKAIEAAERNGSGGRFRYYNDPDLGPILAQDAFQPFRDRFPQPMDNDFYDAFFEDDD